ncbi:alpha/beta fold hydrolase [Curtobacterium sp. ZW137]|uniref:alpha/beta fold hydrolase n=1 Tax=Curtobacterium sp. ZW137 TaxID=2485104 RepID=UPI000F4C42E1|nr:alpha/beta fold hydrolase [Curtobacterium sp. ZW137]ROP66137.1 pimeloyl-ACP methyl ester carboxylesterase [Curtobacterium sp. ZW137]
MHAIRLSDERTVHVDDSGQPETGQPETSPVETGPAAPTLVWHHETPHTGRHLAPVLAHATARGIRLVALTRPGFGGADPLPGRTVADGARDLEQVLDALGIDRVATIGGSGGGPHALAAAALLPDRVSAVATFASPAPFVDTPAWWAGMADDGGLRSARSGREARLTWAETAGFDPAQFTDADWAALDGEWAALGQDAQAAGPTGSEGAADDDLAFVTDWGFALSDVRVPVLVEQGVEDRVIPLAHGRMLASGLPDATFHERADAGHIAVLAGVPQAMDWLLGTLRE